MIYVIHKILVLIKNNLTYLKIPFSNSFLNSIINFKLFFKKTERNYTAIKDIRNFFD